MALVDPDTYLAASHLNERDNLIPVLAAGALDEPVLVGADGRAVVAWTREPLLLLAPAAALGTETLKATVTLDPDGARTVLPTVAFDPFTDAGSFLPVWPGPDLTASPFTIAISVERTERDAAPTVLPGNQVAGAVQLHLLEGVLGRLLYICSAEKQRIRRAAREVASARSLLTARSASLDRHGNDLGVARFTDMLEFVAGPPPEIVTMPRSEPDGRENDTEYRWRLRAVRPIRVANRASVLNALNGPGLPGDPPAGALAALGPVPASRLRLLDRPADFAVAVKLVAGGDDGARTRLLGALRRDRLVRPVVSPSQAADYGGRFSPGPQRKALDSLSAAVRAGFGFSGDAAPDPALATGLARALARVAACRTALGVATPWTLTRAQLADGGSRYELGLGADLALPAAAEVAALRQAVTATTRPRAADPEIEALLDAMAAAGPDPADDELRWLLEPCGLRTVHRTGATTLFVSHMPMQGLTITAPSVAPLSGWSHLAVGSFVARLWPQQMLRYDRVRGHAELVLFDDAGMEQVQRAVDGWRTTWDAVVAFRGGRNLSAGGFDGLLLYDRAAGEAAIEAFNVDATPVTLVSATGWRKTWTLVAAGRFSGAGTTITDAVRYDSAAGDLEVAALQRDGSERLFATLSNQRSTWSSIVTARIDDGETDVLLLYDRHAGSVELYRVCEGRLVLAGSRARWRPGYSHLVAAPLFLMGVAGSQLVGYDREAGVADIISIGPDGTLRILATVPAGRRLWSHVVGGALVPGRTSNVAFYDRGTGRLLVAAALPFSEEPSSSSAEFPVSTGWFGRSIGLFSRAYRVWTGSPTVDGTAQVLGTRDTTSHAFLTDALTRAAAAWAARGGEAWTTQTAPASQTAIWQQVVDPGAAATAFAQAGLPTATAAQQVATPLGQLPPELVATLQLGPTLSTTIAAGGDVDQLRGLVSALAAAGLDSALGLRTGPQQITIVVGVIGLPFAGLNLSDRRSTGFRWYAVPIGDLPGTVKAVGSRTTYQPVAPGVTALVAVAKLHGVDTPDPYEMLVELPAGATLRLGQYELAMNLLDEWHPAGVSVNTFNLRRQHVDLDGDGVADPLPPALARSFRQYRRRGRTTGAGATTINPIAL
jgi:hypothetical protein